MHLTDALVDIVEERCDLAVRISGPPSDKSTIWRKVCEVPRHLVAAPALFNRLPRPESPEELDPAVCMSYSSTGEAESWKLSYGGRTRNVSAGVSVVSNNGDFLYELAKAGNGIALLPDFIVSDGIASGEVKAVLGEWAAPPLWLTLFYPPYEVLPPLVATFTDFFETHLREATGLNFEAVRQ